MNNQSITGARRRRADAAQAYAHCGILGFVFVFFRSVDHNIKALARAHVILLVLIPLSAILRRRRAPILSGKIVGKGFQI